MIRRFFKDAAIYGFTNILSKSISIFLVPFYTRVLTPYDYGILDMTAIVSSIVAIVVPMEISQGVARFMADDENKEEKKITSSIGIFFTFIAFTFFVVFVFLFKERLSDFIYDDKTSNRIVVWAAINMFATGMFYFVQNQLRWLLRAKYFTILSITYTLTSISFTIFFVLFVGRGVVGIINAQTVAGFLCFSIGLYFTRDCYGWKISRKKLKSMLNYSWVLVPSSMTSFFTNYSQRVLLKSFVGLSNLGIYGAASRISSVVNVTLKGFRTATMPLIFANYKKPETPAKISKIFELISTYFLILVVILSVFSKELMIVLTTPKYYSASVLVPFLLIDQYFHGLMVFIPGISITKKTKIRLGINISGAIINIISSIFFILWLQELGAAISVAISSILVFSITLYFSQRLYFIPYYLKKFVSMLFISFFFIAVGFVDFPYFSLTQLFLLKPILIIIFIAFLFLFKILNTHDFKSFKELLNSKFKKNINK